MVEKERKEFVKTHIQHVCFDVGGVIFEFSGGLNALADNLGIDFETCKTSWLKFDNDVCKGSMTPQEMFEKMRKKFKPEVETFDFNDFWIGYCKPHNLVHMLMEQVSQYYDISLLTNAYPGLLEKFTKKGFVPKLNYNKIIESCNIGLVKPDKQIFLYTQQLLGSEPTSIYFIDDSPTNILEAKNLGWQGYLFNTSNQEESIAQIKKDLHL